MALNRLRWVGCIFYTKIISILFFYCNFAPGISLNLKIVTMRLPEDPVMLYSFINMKLRDFYPSLDALRGYERRERGHCTKIEARGI